MRETFDEMNAKELEKVRQKEMDQAFINNLADFQTISARFMNII